MLVSSSEVILNITMVITVRTPCLSSTRLCATASRIDLFMAIFIAFLPSQVNACLFLDVWHIKLFCCSTWNGLFKKKCDSCGELLGRVLLEAHDYDLLDAFVILFLGCS